MNEDLTIASKLPVIGLLSALIITALVGFCVPKINYQNRGIFLPAKTNTRYAVNRASDVAVLTKYPKVYKKLGEIRIERHYLGQNKATEQSIIDYAKTLAGQQGATAIVLQQFFVSQPTGVESGLPSYSFIAVALHAVPRGG